MSKIVLTEKISFNANSRKLHADNRRLLITKYLRKSALDLRKSAFKKSYSKITKIAFFDVDTQFDFINPRGKLFIKGAPKIISNFKKLTSFAKRKRITIISSIDTHIKNDPEFKIFPAH